MTSINTRAASSCSRTRTQSNADSLINLEIAYTLIGRDAETGYPIVDLIQITENEIRRIDEMMNVSSEAESGRDFDLITEQEAQLYQRENTVKDKEQCVDSDVDNNSSLPIADELQARPAAIVKPINHLVTMSVKAIEMMPSGLLHVLLLPKRSSAKVSLFYSSIFIYLICSHRGPNSTWRI